LKDTLNLPNSCSLEYRWLARELRHVNPGDKRLAKRLIKTGNLIEEKASGSINESCKTWKESKGAYRLFDNKRFKAKMIYDSHHKETNERIKGHQFVFSIQDTTYLDYDSHAKTKDLGSISKAYTKHKMGLILHSTLILSMKGLPLGLGSQQCWARTMREENVKEKARRRYKSPIEDKESYKWATALKETINIIPEDTKIITIGDREADLFEFLWDAQELGTLFVVRNRQNRKLICPKTGKTKLQTGLDQLSTKQEMDIEVPRKGNQRARTATLEIKYMFGEIPIRSASLYGPEKTKHKISDRIPVYVIRAKEVAPPEGVEAIDWVLLTNVPVTCFEEALERIEWYKLRWRIEEFFKVLKSGCKIESSRLATKERLEKLIALKSIIAFKILYLSKVTLINPEEPCTNVLTAQEWKVLYRLEHKTVLLPEKPPSINQVILWLGKLGGFLNRKNDKLPGTTSLWRGYEKLWQCMEVLNIFTLESYG